jgi:hypothetical protein
MGLRAGVLTAVLIAAGLALPGASAAQALYAASVRSIAEGDDPLLGGSLYSVALASASATLIAPIRLNGTSPLGITGLASQPGTGVLYGITSSQSRTNPLSLVILDPATGNARMVGPLKMSGSDIAFNRAGILFTWLPATSQLGVVNMDSGTVTPIGNPGPAGPPAGLAIDSQGIAYITAKGATGTLDRVDIATGVVRTGPPLTGAPFDSTINSMTFTPSGLLLAVNSNAGAPASTRLIAINTATGAIATIGTLPDDTDGIAFASGLDKDAASTIDWRNIALIALGIIGLILGLISWLVGRK